MRNPSSLSTPLLGLAFGALALCQAAAAAPQTAAQQGLTVVRDADTGELRAPTAAETQALQPQAAASSARQQQPTMVTGADGRQSVYLGNSQHVYAIVKRGADGKLDHQCAEGADAAHAHLNHDAPAAAQAQEKARHEHR